MIATLDRLQTLRQKLERIETDEHDRGLCFLTSNEKALLIRLIDEYLIEAEEVLAEGSIGSGTQPLS